MARGLHNKLTVVGVANQKKPGLYGDGGGLWLRIAPRGSRSWMFRFSLAGRTREAGLGSLNNVSLAAARETARRYRELVAQGIDPIERRAEEQAARQKPAVPTFREVGEALIRAREASWRNKKHGQQWRHTLRDYAYPTIGDRPVDQIDVAAILSILKPIWYAKPETASRVRSRCEAVLASATVLGHRQGPNPAVWRGSLDQLLPPKGRVRRASHHPALPYREIPRFMAALRVQTATSAGALEFIVLTACRTSEGLLANFDEFESLDGDNPLWRIPPERTKVGRQHIVPLPARAAELVREQQKMWREGLVFPGSRAGSPLSETTLLAALGRLGRGDITVHGFRSTFRDWAAECTPFPGEVAEAALAHAVSDRVVAAYRRTSFLEQRRQLLIQWAEFCNSEFGFSQV